MTVAIDLNRVVYVGNAVTTVFPFSFTVPDASYLQVYLYTTATGALALLTLNVDYTVSGVPGAGGVTYNPLGVPMPATQKLIILRVVPLLQGLDINNQGGFYPDTVEAQLDLMVMGLQQLEEKVGRAVIADVMHVGQTLPNPVADNMIGWNAAGTALENKTLAALGAVVVSDDATMAANSHTIIPTQYAVKTFVTTAVTAATILALPGLSIANYAGANENAKIAAMYASAPTQPYVYRADSHFGIIRDTAPLNYQGTEALLVTQKRHTTDLGAQIAVPSVVFQQTVDANGAVTAASDISETIWMGVFSATTKTGDGSAHTYTATGELHDVGPGGYNELGLFQGENTNISSARGSLSGLEVQIKDGPSAGVHFDTRMYGAASRLNRRHAGVRRSDCYVAASEGSQPVNSAFTINQIAGASPGGFLRYIDFSLAPISTTGQAILLPNNVSLAWMNGAGSTAIPSMFLSATNELWLTGATTTSSVIIGNSALAKSLQVAGSTLGVNFVEIAGNTAGNAPTIWVKGTDTDISITWATKGTGVHSFYTNGASFAKQMEIGHVASSVNYLSLKGAVTTGHPIIAAAGTDANPSLIVQGKGTGGVILKDGAAATKFQTNTTGVGFFAATPVVKQTVGAALSTGGAETNVNLATRINDLRTALINYGLAA